MFITATNDPLPFTIETKNGEATFLISPITGEDFDQLGYELFRHGIYPVSMETFRATMIDEVFNLYPEAEAEAAANLLDEFWQAEDIFTDQIQRWMAQEEQRRFDIAHGAKGLEAAEAPVRVMPARSRHRAQLKADDILKVSQRMRDLSIDMQTYDGRASTGLARLVVCGWSGVETPFVKEGGIVPAETWAALKREIGKPAAMEIEKRVKMLGNLSEMERGNSDSPLENGSDLTGSPAPSDASGSSDGNSTSGEGTTTSSSNTAAIPDSESAGTTAASSNSTIASAGETSSIAPTPTAEG